MKLPVIKHLTQFVEANDEDYLIEAIEVLEYLTEQNPIEQYSKLNMYVMYGA